MIVEETQVSVISWFLKWSSCDIWPWCVQVCRDASMVPGFGEAESFEDELKAGLLPHPEFKE